MQRKYIFISFVAIMATAFTVAYFKVAANPSANVSQTQNSGLITSRISVVYGLASQTESWAGIDGYAGRFPVGPNETIQLKIQLTQLEAGKAVWVEAPHGGVLNGNRNHFSWTPQRADEVLELGYQVGRSRGVYLISLRQGNRTETIEFWAGEPSPLGEAGSQTGEVQ